jgi:hypothetical protein
MIFHKKIVMLMVISFVCLPVVGHDVLLEVKGDLFIPTNSQSFSDIYGTCGQFGLELTAGCLSDVLYAFSSIDFTFKNGSTMELTSPTKISMIDLAFGLKYFIPFSYGDVYIGLGVKPTYLAVDNQDSGPAQPALWNCGGVGKVGVIFDMPHSFFADIFFDYSFVKFPSASMQSSSTAINGSVLGIGFGYRFN